MKKIFFSTILAVSTLLSAETAFSQMKPNLGKLTSDETAEKVKSDIPSGPNGFIPGLQKHSAGLGIGQTFLRSDFEDNGEDKITIDFYYNYSASYSFDFVANLHFTDHEFRNTETELKGLALAIKGKLYQFDAFAPYALGGFGFYQPQVTQLVNGVLRDSDSKLVFGINFGGGVDLALNERVTVGALFHYHDPFDVKQENGSTVEGSYYKLLLTAMYTFN